MRPLRFGAVLQGVDAPREFVAHVREIESLGYDQLWITDSSLHARDVYSYLTLAATASTRLQLGSAVTNPLTRHPALGAVAIATVDDVSERRAVYGIGAGDRPVHALGLRPARLEVLREAIAVTRRLWRGEHVTVGGHGFALDGAHMRVAARPDIPIYVSASGPKTLELAGEIAEGAIVLAGLFPEGIRYARARVEAGRARSGRVDDADVAVFAYGSLREDASLAVEEARSIAAWFCQTAPVYCDLAGVPADLVRQVRDAYAGGEFQEARNAGRLIPADLVQKLALAGTGADALAKARMLLDEGIRNVNVFPLGADRLGTLRVFAREVIAHFRGRRS